MIELRLYKCQKGDGHHFDDIIQYVQKRKGDPNPEHIHVELAFVGAQFENWDGWMFSSSGRGGFLGEGTRFTSSYIDKDKWDIYTLILELEQEIKVLAMSSVLVGARYDWLGILGMALPWNMQRRCLWYCSEVVNNGSLKGIADYNPKIRPGQLLDAYRKQGLI